MNSSEKESEISFVFTWLLSAACHSLRLPFHLPTQPNNVFAHSLCRRWCLFYFHIVPASSFNCHCFHCFSLSQFVRLRLRNETRNKKICRYIWWLLSHYRGKRDKYKLWCVLFLFPGYKWRYFAMQTTTTTRQGLYLRKRSTQRPSENAINFATNRAERKHTHPQTFPIVRK